MASLRTVMQPVEITPAITTCRDPKDNMFLDLAVQGGAKYLISGDADLLDLHPFQSVSIVPPSLFLNICL